MTDTILLPVEGGDRHEAVVERALDLAARRDATVHALYVVDTKRYGEPALSTAEIVVDGVEDKGRELLADVAERARQRGVEATTRCCHGQPNEELPAYAAEIDADAVVLGGRRRPARVRAELDRTCEIVTPGALAGGR